MFLCSWCDESVVVHTCTIRIFNDFEGLIENCSASWGLPNSYSEWRNFQFTPNSHYGFFFLHTVFRNYIYAWKYVILSNLRSKTTFFDQELFGSVPI